MLKARYADTALVPEEPVDLPEDTNVILQAFPAPRSGLWGDLRLTKAQAIYRGGVFLLKHPLKVREGSVVGIVAFSPVRSLHSFQGLLGHLKEDGVTLQHKAREWWGQSAH